MMEKVISICFCRKTTESLCQFCIIATNRDRVVVKFKEISVLKFVPSDALASSENFFHLIMYEHIFAAQ